MAIIEQEDFSGETQTIVKGVIAQIRFQQNEKVDQFGGTHRASVRIDEDWVNGIGLKVKEGFDPQIRINAGNQSTPNWVTIEAGDEVSMIVKPNEYNGKTYYNGSTSNTKFKLIKKGAGAPAQTSSGKPSTGTVTGGSTYQKRDTSGIETGHALNGALLAVGHNPEVTNEELIVLGKSVHDTTVKLKEWYAKENPTFGDYDVGAAVGHAVLNALRSGYAIDDIEDYSKNLLTNVVPGISEHIKSAAEKPKTKVTPAKKPTPAVKKPAVKKATPVVKKEVAEQSDDTPPVFDDDDVPFN